MVQSRTLLSIIVFFMYVLVTGCGSRENNDTNHQGSIRQTNISSEITPINFKIETDDEHVSTIIKDTLDLAELNLTEGNLLGYKIILYVSSLDAPGFWFRQTPIDASVYWSAKAFLGGKGQYSAKNGEVFKVAQILSKNNLPSEIKSLSELEQDYEVTGLPRMRTITVYRKK